MESFATPYPLIFTDGETEVDKGVIGIHSVLTFKRFQALMSQKTGLPTAQLSSMFVCRKSGEDEDGSGKRQRVPIGESTNFNIFLNQHNPMREKDCYFLCAVKRGKKDRKQPRKKVTPVGAGDGGDSASSETAPPLDSARARDDASSDTTATPAGTEASSPKHSPSVSPFSEQSPVISLGDTYKQRDDQNECAPAPAEDESADGVRLASSAQPAATRVESRWQSGSLVEKLQVAAAAASKPAAQSSKQQTPPMPGASNGQIGERGNAERQDGAATLLAAECVVAGGTAAEKGFDGSRQAAVQHCSGEQAARSSRDLQGATGRGPQVAQLAPEAEPAAVADAPTAPAPDLQHIISELLRLEGMAAPPAPDLVQRGLAPHDQVPAAPEAARLDRLATHDHTTMPPPARHMPQAQHLHVGPAAQKRGKPAAAAGQVAANYAITAEDISNLMARGLAGAAYGAGPVAHGRPPLCKFCIFCQQRKVDQKPFHSCPDDRVVVGFRGPSPAGPIGRPSKRHVEAAA